VSVIAEEFRTSPGSSARPAGTATPTFLTGREPEDGSQAEPKVETRLLLLFHRLRGAFRDFVEIRLRDVEVLKP
jgi:hypothetical protein